MDLKKPTYMHTGYTRGRNTGAATLHGDMRDVSVLCGSLRRTTANGGQAGHASMTQQCIHSSTPLYPLHTEGFPTYCPTISRLPHILPHNDCDYNYPVPRKSCHPFGCGCVDLKRYNRASPALQGWYRCRLTTLDPLPVPNLETRPQQHGCLQHTFSRASANKRPASQQLQHQYSASDNRQS